VSISRKWVTAKWTSDRNCARLTREEIVTSVLDLLLTGMVLVILSPSKHFFHVKQRTGHIRCLTAANTIAKYKGVMEGEVISAVSGQPHSRQRTHKTLLAIVRTEPHELTANLCKSETNLKEASKAAEFVS
jgi:hypothetical protein